MGLEILAGAGVLPSLEPFSRWVTQLMASDTLLKRNAKWWWIRFGWREDLALRGSRGEGNREERSGAETAPMTENSSMPQRRKSFRNCNSELGRDCLRHWSSGARRRSGDDAETKMGLLCEWMNVYLIGWIRCGDTSKLWWRRRCTDAISPSAPYLSSHVPLYVACGFFSEAFVLTILTRFF